MIILGFVLVISLMANFLANELPLRVVQDNQVYWPLVRQMLHGDTPPGFDPDKPCQSAIYAPIPFGTAPADDMANRYLPPLSMSTYKGENQRHWLGTDRLGRDVAACMVYGCRRSILISLIAMLIAGAIGTVLGLVSGYWGNRYRIMRPWVLLLVALGLLYLLYLQYFGFLGKATSSIAMIIILLLGHFMANRKGPARSMILPLDSLMLKIIEVIQAIPALMILLAISAFIAQPGMWILAIIIGLIKWPGFARYARGEVLKIRTQEYVKAARISGLSHTRIIRSYILPEASGPLLVAAAFGAASVILLESTLSFLGLGVPPEQVTWGSLLGQAKLYTQAWWLATFPGLAIFMVITALNLGGDHLKTRWNAED